MQLKSGYVLTAVVVVENNERQEVPSGLNTVSHQLIGDTNIYTEHILNCLFKVHANAFLQVNTTMCHQLYTHIFKQAFSTQNIYNCKY